MTQHKPTPEQEAVIQHFAQSPKSLMVEAYAGAAKSTTLEMSIKAMDPPPGTVLLVAFNKKIAVDAENRLGLLATCSTLNALGHRAWGGFIKKKLSVDANKMYSIIQEVLQGEVADEEYVEVALNVRGLVQVAKNAGLVPSGAQNETLAKRFYPDSVDGWEELASSFDLECNDNYIAFAREALRRSIKAAFSGLIDFNDQLYMSTCWPAPFAQFPIVVVDEAQDLSVLNHHMIAKCVALGGKLVVIGDRYQSIYAFRGADLSSMDKLKERFKMDTLLLSTTFRCARNIAEHVKDRVPFIQSPAWAKPGVVETLDEWTLDDIQPQSAVICRNNKPLISLAYQFIRAGRPVVINGGDFGEMLMKLLRKMAGAVSKSESKNREKLTRMSIGELLSAIDRWEEKETADAHAKNKPYRISAIEDKAGSLRVIISSSHAENAQEVMEELHQVFNNKIGSVVLSSGHKSKGLEWDTVYHLNPHLCPSRYALRKADEGDRSALEQELNLRYVISTRAKNRLVYITNEKETSNEQARNDSVDVVADLPDSLDDFESPVEDDGAYELPNQIPAGYKEQ